MRPERRVHSREQLERPKKRYLQPPLDKIETSAHVEVSAVVVRLRENRLHPYKMLVDMVILARILIDNNLKELATEVLLDLEKLGATIDKNKQSAIKCAQGLSLLMDCLPQNCYADLRRVAKQLINLSKDSDPKSEAKGWMQLAEVEIAEAKEEWSQKQGSLAEDSTADPDLLTIFIRDHSNVFEERGRAALQHLEHLQALLKRIAANFGRLCERELTAEYWYTKANIYLSLSSLDTDYYSLAQTAFEKSQQFAGNAGLLHLKDDSQLNQGVLYLGMEHFDKALEFFHEHLRTCLKKDNHEGAVLARFNIAVCCRSKRKYARAEESVRKGLEAAKKIRDPQQREKELADLVALADSIQASQDSFARLEKLLAELRSSSSEGFFQLAEQKKVEVIELVAFTSSQQLLFSFFYERSVGSEQLKDKSDRSLLEIPALLFGPFYSEIRLPSLEGAKLFEHVPLVHLVCEKFGRSQNLLLAFQAMLLQNNLYKPMAVFSFVKVLSFGHDELSKLVFAENWVNFAASVDDWCDLLRKRRGSTDTCTEIPECVELVHKKALEVAISLELSALVAVVLVNLEIIYKKYGDKEMADRVGQQIERFKRTKNCKSVTIALRSRVGLVDPKATLQPAAKATQRPDPLAQPVQESRLSRLLDQKAEEDSDKQLYQEFFLLGDFASRSRPVPVFAAPESLDQHVQLPSFNSTNPASGSPLENQHLAHLAQTAVIASAAPDYSPLGPYLAANLSFPPFSLQTLFASPNLNLSGLNLTTAAATSLFLLVEKHAPVRLSLLSADFSRNKLDASFLGFLSRPNSFAARLSLENVTRIDVRCNRLAATEDLQAFERRLNLHVREVLVGAVAVAGERALEQRGLLHGVFEKLARRPVIERLVFGGCSLAGLRGMALGVCSLRVLEVPCNLVPPEEMAWILIQRKTLFPRLRLLDLSSQPHSPWNGSIPLFLHEVADLKSISLSKDSSIAVSSVETKLLLRDNSAFVDFVVSAFLDDQQSPIWQHLKQAIRDFDRVQVRPCHSLHLDTFCEMLEHPGLH